MSNNAQKQPLAQLLNGIAKSGGIDATEHLGYSLPCEIKEVHHDTNEVTVKFLVQSGWTIPDVKIPIAMSEYVRIPYQVGDKGYCNAMDTRNTDANMVQVGNLTGLVFVPISQKDWSTTDKDRLTLYGKTAVDIKGTSGGTVTITVEDGKVTITGDVKITGDVTVTGKITATGDIKAGIISLQNHKHGGVMSGNSTTTPSIP
jgi:hypothetical protein